MDFGLFFFASRPRDRQTNPYRLLLEAAQFADKSGFCAIWTPERHFDAFGSIFPNPAVLSAALATITNSIQLRAGSLISPLHDTVRIAEEWAVVDNLSRGRVAISFGSGWNINDFIFFPERYLSRKTLMLEQIKQLRLLWEGGEIQRQNSFGKSVTIRLYPRPVQSTLPVWVTSSGNVETFVEAGKIGANILTHLIGQDLNTLAEKIRRYRETLRAHGYMPEEHNVALMLHTFVGIDPDSIYAQVREPLREYLRSAVLLEHQAAQGGGTISGGHQLPAEGIADDLMEELLDITFERYYQQAALIGTVEKCQPLVRKLAMLGVDEIACLIDFGVADEEVLKSLVFLNQLRLSCQSM